VASRPKSLLISRRLAASGVALGVAAVGGAAVTLYVQREAIAVRLAFEYLRAHGVPADIHLDRFDLGGVSGSVRLGPRRRPDLTVRNLQAQFGPLPAPWGRLRPPPVKSLTLVQPVLRARWADGRLRFGDLQPLIDQSLSAKPTGGAPPPDLHVRDGRLLLDTPAGPVVVALDLDVVGGAVQSLHARLEPADLSALGLRIAAVQGVMSGQGAARGGLHITGAFSAARGVSGAGGGARGAASGLTLTVDALTPSGRAEPTGAAGQPLVAALRVRAGRFAVRPRTGGPVEVQGGQLSLDLDGQVDGRGEFAGRLRALGDAQHLARGDVLLTAAALQLQSDAARASSAAGRVEASGPFVLRVSTAGGRARLAGASWTLAPGVVQASGQARFDRSLSVGATGAAMGGLDAAPTAAAALARRVLGSVDPASADALAQALRRVRLDVPAYRLAYGSARGLALSLDQPAAARVDGGEITVHAEGRGPMLQADPAGRLSGALAAAVQVRGLPFLALEANRYAFGPGDRASLDGGLDGQGSFGPLERATLRVRGRLTRDGDRWALQAADCVRLTAAAVRNGGALAASGVEGEACPTPAGPLLQLGRGTWGVRTDARDLRLLLPGAQVRAAVPSLAVALEGRAASVDGHLQVRDAAVDDLSPTPRVRPLLIAGALELAGHAASGRFDLRLAKGQVPAGALTLAADWRQGSGAATLDTGRLFFKTDGLQPGDIAPATAQLLPEAAGPLQVVAHLGWSRSGALALSGELSADGLSFRSPAGRLSGVRGRVALVSLSPLMSAPDQTLTADRLDTAIPLTNLKTRFTIAPDRVQLNELSADVAGGALRLDPMAAPLSPKAPVSGVLRLHRVDLQQVIDTLNLANSVKLQAQVDGQLPFSLQPSPGGGRVLRLAQGRIFADAPGRLSIARQALAGGVATAGAAGAQPNAVQDFAYQALEDLAFTRLEAAVASRPGGRLGVVFHVVGEHDPKVSRPTRIGLLALLRGHAFDKPLPLPKGTPVDLTLDTSLNLDDILDAYLHLGGSAPVQR
jgi:hypothetical protein